MIRIRISTAVRRDLEDVARATRQGTITAVIREAVNEYVADFREQAVFPGIRGPQR